jgi:hypothetical protein
MGKRSRRRAKDEAAPAAATTDYRDDEGNVLTLRDELSSGTLRKVRWEIAGLPLEGQKELLGRYRLASSSERQQVRKALAEHLAQRHPDVTI